MTPQVQPDDYTLKQLPLTLYSRNHTTTTGYSKVSRGLRFPLEVPGLNTRNRVFGRHWLGTVVISLDHSCKSTINRQGITLKLLQKFDQNHVFRTSCSSTHQTYTKTVTFALTSYRPHLWRTYIFACLPTSLLGSDYILIFF